VLILKLESSGSWWWRFGDPSLHCFLTCPPVWRTDRRRDKIAMAKTRYSNYRQQQICYFFETQRR